MLKNTKKQEEIKKLKLEIKELKKEYSNVKKQVLDILASSDASREDKEVLKAKLLIKISRLEKELKKKERMLSDRQTVVKR